jgi:integrase
MAILADCPTCHRKQSVRNKICVCGENIDKAKQARKVKYWIHYRIPGGKQRLEKIGFSIEEARDAEGKRRGQKREGRIFEMLPASKITFKELAEWFLPIEKNKVLSEQISEEYFKIKKIHLESFNSIYGDLIVNEIVSADLEVYKAKRKQPSLSDSYIDQELGSVATMINTAFENEKVGGRPFKVFKTRKRLLKKKNSNARDRVLSFDEYLKLVNKLPKHARVIVATAFWTGMRRGEILNLTWDKIDLNKRLLRLETQDTKEGAPKVIPIARILKDMLVELPDRIRSSNKPKFVFLYKGKPIKDLRDALKRGCKVAGIPYGRKVKNGFTFHDLRHTFATIARKAGISRNIIMVIMGHSDVNDMNLRYDRIDPSDLIEDIDRFERYLSKRKRSKQDSEENIEKLI